MGRVQRERGTGAWEEASPVPRDGPKGEAERGPGGPVEPSLGLRTGLQLYRLPQPRVSALPTAASPCGAPREPFPCSDSQASKPVPASPFRCSRCTVRVVLCSRSPPAPGGVSREGTCCREDRLSGGASARGWLSSNTAGSTPNRTKQTDVGESCSHEMSQPEHPFRCPSCSWACCSPKMIHFAAC